MMARLTASASLQRAEPGSRRGKAAHELATGGIVPMTCEGCACISQYQYNLDPSKYEECASEQGALCGCFSYQGGEYCMSGEQAIEFGKTAGIPVTSMRDYLAVGFDKRPKKCVRERDTQVPVTIGLPVGISVY